MALKNPECMGDYDFDQIALFAKKRYIDGYNTVSLMQQAKTEREKEEIALVCMLNVEDNEIKDINLDCRYAKQCRVTTCRSVLRDLIKMQLGEDINFES